MTDTPALVTWLRELANQYQSKVWLSPLSAEEANRVHRLIAQQLLSFADTTVDLEDRIKAEIADMKALPMFGATSEEQLWESRGQVAALQWVLHMAHAEPRRSQQGDDGYPSPRPPE